MMCIAIHPQNTAETYSRSSPFHSYRSRLIIWFCLAWVFWGILFVFIIHHDTFLENQLRVCMHIKRGQGIIQIRSQALLSALHLAGKFSVLSQPFKYSNILTLRKQTVTSYPTSVCDGRSPSRHGLSWNQDLQQNVWSDISPPTEQCSQMSHTTVQETLEQTRLLSPYWYTDKLETIHPSLLKKRGYITITEHMKELGNHDKHILDE